MNHSSWTCVLALLQRRRRPTPRVHISTNVVDHLFFLAVPRVDRRHIKDRVSKWRASSSPISRSVTKRVTASRLEAIAIPWYPTFFSKSRPAARPSLKTPARRLLDVTITVARWTCASKNIGKERGSPQVKSMSNALINNCARQVGASSAWFYSLAWIFLYSPERLLRGSDRDPARQTETCEYEPCVNLALRS